MRCRHENPSEPERARRRANKKSLLARAAVRNEPERVRGTGGCAAIASNQTNPSAVGLHRARQEARADAPLWLPKTNRPRRAGSAKEVDHDEIGSAGHAGAITGDRPGAGRPRARSQPAMIRAAIVGLGWWGRTIVRRLDGSDRLRLVRAVDVKPEAAAPFAAERGLPLSARLDDALGDPEVTAVILATPHSLHKSQALAAAAAGKHVFCEKPLALRAAHAREMVRACQERGLVLGIGHERRFEPALIETKRLIDAGELGTIMHLEANFSHDKLAQVPADDWRSSKADSPLPAITGMGVHLSDAFIHMIGEVTEVFTLAARRVLASEGGDVASVLVRFASGATGCLNVILVTPLYLRFTVFGSKAWVEVRNDSHPDTPGASTLVLCREGDTRESRGFAWTDTVRANLEAFADAISGRGAYPFTDAQKIANVAVLEALCESARTGHPVRPASWGNDKSEG
jgi:predicted dehydrogenase